MIQRILLFIKLRVLSILPERAKYFLRGIKLLFVKPMIGAPSIPQDLLNDAKLISNRNIMLEHLPKAAVVAEIGVLHGNYSHEIITRTMPKEFHLIDVDFSTLREDVSAHPSVIKHEKFSNIAMATFPDDYFDWIYVDGDHSYEGVKSDIRACIPKLKTGGYLVFNDFCRINLNGLGVFGVQLAVTELIVEQKWPLKFFAFESGALYDVAVQKPYI
ncbi:MAG: class I SAM-dependent methyltransferase [Alphaproteobacteria bacterium]